MDMQLHTKKPSRHISSNQQLRKPGYQKPNQLFNDMPYHQNNQKSRDMYLPKGPQPHVNAYGGYYDANGYPIWKSFPANGQRRKSFSQQTMKNVGKPQMDYMSYDERKMGSTRPYFESEDDTDAICQLKGFKVVQNGRVIHDKTHEIDFRLMQQNQRMMSLEEKFASSELTISPNSKCISIPVFMGSS